MLSVNYKGHDYQVDNNNDILIISIDGVEKSFRLREVNRYDYDYVLQIKKTIVKCKSIAGLMKHFKDCIDENFALEAWCIDPLEHIYNNVKCL